MKQLYSQPKKVILLIILISVLGLLSLNKLPVALYPNSAKPQFMVNFNLQSYTPRDFLNQYGFRIKSVLNKLDHVESIHVSAGKTWLQFNVTYTWEAEPDQTKKDFTSAIEGFRGTLPYDLQRDLWYGPSQRNSGFFAASIFAEDGNLDALREKLNPLIMPQIESLKGVSEAVLVDSNQSYLYVTIDPEKMAYHRLNIHEVNRFLRNVISSVNAGKVTISGKSYQVLLKNHADDFEALAEISMASLGRPGLTLSDVAKVELAPRTQGNRIMRTNGRASLILWVQPDDNGNLKYICESVVATLKNTYDQWPSGAIYRVLVDPSQFIRSAISNVISNIVFGGVLAVLILMLFVGSIRSTIFTAIEIPLAIVWAFILMHLFDVSLNLISLGGLALTAGMNIDASIVMVENILRHLKGQDPKDYPEKISVIGKAVDEVKIPIITSTLSTIIVFLPLSMTSGITYAILGDLAKAVIFSHGFAAVIAIFLVPTIRANTRLDLSEPQGFLGQFQKFFEKFQSKYEQSLVWLIQSPKRRGRFLLSVALTIVTVTSVCYPLIRKEIVALPNTDSIWVQLRPRNVNNTNEIAQMVKPYEVRLIKELDQYVKYVYTTIWSAHGGGMFIKLQDKDEVDEAFKAISNLLKNTPQISFMPMTYNPSKLPLPNPPDLEIYLTGPEKDRIEAADLIENDLEGIKEYRAVWHTLSKGTRLRLDPKFDYLDNLISEGGPSVHDLGSMLHTVLSGQRLGFVKTDDGVKEIRLRYPQNYVASTEDLAALPIIAGDWVLPLKALVQISDENFVSALYEEDGREVTKVSARIKREFKDDKHKINDQAKIMVEKLNLPPGVHASYVDSDKEINESLLGVLLALAISLLLIFSILFLQFNQLKEALIVMASIPLGAMGVSLALLVFESTWSINSLLGIILLGGISVNNSILLMSFFKQRLKQGWEVTNAAIDSAKTRLRPIVVTSLTTIIAMTPIAFSLGDGTEVLQPLGIAVSCGMFFSTLLTLYVIPCLEVSFVRKSN